MKWSGRTIEPATFITHLQSNSLQPDVLVLGAHLTALHDGVACCLHPPSHLLQTSSCYPTCTMDTHRTSITAQQSSLIEIHKSQLANIYSTFQPQYSVICKAKGMVSTGIQWQWYWCNWPGACFGLVVMTDLSSSLAFFTSLQWVYAVTLYNIII